MTGKKTLSRRQLSDLCWKVWERAEKILDNVYREKVLDSDMDEEVALLRSLIWEIRWELEMPANDPDVATLAHGGRYADSCWAEINRLLNTHGYWSQDYKRIIKEELLDRVLRKAS